MGKTAKPADYFFKEAEACRLLFLGGQKTTKIKALVPPDTPDKKIIKIFFLRFDIINKLPFAHIFIKLLLMAPFYV